MIELDGLLKIVQHEVCKQPIRRLRACMKLSESIATVRRRSAKRNDYTTKHFYKLDDYMKEVEDKKQQKHD